MPSPNHVQQLSYTRGLPWLLLQTFLKSVKIFHKIFHKPQTSKRCLVLLANQSQVWHNRQPFSTCIATPIRWLQIWHKLKPVLAWNLTSIKCPHTWHKCTGLCTHGDANQRLLSLALVAPCHGLSTSKPSPSVDQRQITLYLPLGSYKSGTKGS